MTKKKTHILLATAVVLLLVLPIGGAAAVEQRVFSTRLIHRFSKEVSGGSSSAWPENKSLEHMRMLLESDLKRQVLVGGQGRGHTVDYGNDLGWLHYTWIDIGTPNNSFLVALDTGSDMLWVPCECIECASLSQYNVLAIGDCDWKPFSHSGFLPLMIFQMEKEEEIKKCCFKVVGSLLFGASIVQERELSEYKPSHSNSSKRVLCSHELCEMGPDCKNPDERCPYSITYLSKDTSSSGSLFEDVLHLAAVGGNKQQSAFLASIFIGCGSKQTGDYLQGIAPDGLLGLGPNDISVPSSLANSGLIPHSFSFCYDMSYSGRLLFGDQGPLSQSSTSFSPFNGNHYFVEVESYCVGNTCLKLTEFKVQIDTGSSFTYLPMESYGHVVSEFHNQANATRIPTQGFDYCYKTHSLKLADVPSMRIVFAVNQSFVIENPMFRIHSVDGQGDLYCLGVLPSGFRDVGIIGQNFMMGYRMVFDWEKLKLGWSISDCHLDDGSEARLAPPPSETPYPLPTNDGQRNPNGHAVAPAVAGRASPKPSAASSLISRVKYQTISLPLLLCIRYLI